MERCDNVAAFARQHDIRTSLLYTWRRELRYAVAASQIANADGDQAPMFVPVVADSPRSGANDVAIEVELGGAVVRIGRTATAGLAAAVIQALQVRR